MGAKLKNAVLSDDPFYFSCDLFKIMQKYSRGNLLQRGVGFSRSAVIFLF